MACPGTAKSAGGASGRRSIWRTASQPMKPTSPPVSGGIPGIFGVLQRSVRVAMASSGVPLIGAPIAVAECALDGQAVVEPDGCALVLRQNTEGGDPDEGVAGPDAALRRGLEQERARTRIALRPQCQLAEDADRRLLAGEQLADDRHDEVVSGERLELLAGATGHRCLRGLSCRLSGHPALPSGPPSAGSSGSTSKQACAPVWQAGPIWWTVTSTVSASQSSAAPRTCWTLPEVSPLRQYSCLLRDQKVTRPSPSVRRRASAFM